MYDVIIVGAGPSGSSAAIKLAKKGYKVAILEKKQHPRIKACCGAISTSSKYLLKKLKVDIDDLILQGYKGFILKCKEKKVKYDWGSEKVWSVYRKDFDKLLADTAVDYGANLKEKNKINKIIDRKSHFEVYSNKGKYKSRLLFGADGVNSVVRNSLKIDYPQKTLGVGLISEIKATKREIEIFNDRLILDLSYLDKGLSFIFPKKKGKTIHLAIGGQLSYINSKKINLNSQMLRLSNDYNLRYKPVCRSGSMVPFGGTVKCFGKNNALLLGDSAGLVNPIGEEGIPYALQSGIFAADSADIHFKKGLKLSDVYQQKISNISRVINNQALNFQSMLYGNLSHRKFIISMLNHNTSLLKLFSDLFINEIGYDEALKSISMKKLLPRMIKTYYRESILYNPNPPLPKYMFKWVRLG